MARLGGLVLAKLTARPDIYLRELQTDLKQECAGVREAIEAVGAELHYLPPYSPDFNPIELAFSKLKKLLRDGAQRTVDKLWELRGEILGEFAETECRNYFKHCRCRYT